MKKKEMYILTKHFAAPFEGLTQGLSGLGLWSVGGSCGGSILAENIIPFIRPAHFRDRRILQVVTTNQLGSLIVWQNSSQGS